MEHSGIGIDELLSNSTELFAITGLHRSDLQGEDNSDDSAADEIEDYINELEMHDDEEMDNELEVPPPMHSSTPCSERHWHRGR
jgi:hypothetical protein